MSFETSFGIYIYIFHVIFTFHVFHSMGTHLKIRGHILTEKDVHAALVCLKRLKCRITGREREGIELIIVMMSLYILTSILTQ